MSINSVPYVSVISAWYNRVEDLTLSVDSVLNQQGPDLEYIVIDDASDDEITWKALSSIKDPRFRLYRNKKNIGFTRSMRRAAKLARGRYIAVHDAGDISRPGRISAQCQFLDSKPDFVSVGCAVENHILVSGSRKVQHVQPSPDKVGYTHGEVMFRRDIYEKVGGYRKIFYYAQDSDLWARLREHGKLGTMPEVLYERRIFVDGVYGNGIKAARQATFSMLGNWARDCRQRGEIDPVTRWGTSSILEMPASKRLTQRIRGSAVSLLRERRLLDAKRALDGVPLGQLSPQLAVLNLCLTLFVWRPRNNYVHVPAVKLDSQKLEARNHCPKISVVILESQKTANRLKDVVTSALSQRDIDLQDLIVVGATGSQLEAELQSLCDPRLKILKWNSSFGEGSRFNAALKQVLGDIIVVHSTESPWVSDQVIAQIQAIETRPQYAAVYSERSCTKKNEVGFPVAMRRRPVEGIGGARSFFYYAAIEDLLYRLSEHCELSSLRNMSSENRGTWAGFTAGEDGRVRSLKEIYSNLAGAAAAERRSGQPDPIDQRGVLSILEQPRSLCSDRFFHSLALEYMRNGRFSDLREILDLLPTGFVGVGLALLHLILQLLGFSATPKPLPDYAKYMLPKSLREPKE
jgi:glycosyltransferase involved in cell wall biosynthesis